MAGPGEARLGLARQGFFAARLGKARRGSAGRGMARLGSAGQGFFAARLGEARLGEAGLGGAWRGRVFSIPKGNQ